MANQLEVWLLEQREYIALLRGEKVIQTKHIVPLIHQPLA